MRKQWVVVIAILAIAAAAIFALLRFGPQVEELAVGKPLPDFPLVKVGTTDTVSLRDHYKGDVTLVNIWATWCIPCRTEMPSMQEAYAALKPEGFHIAAISVDQGSPDAVQQFAREMGLTFDIYQDRSTRIEQIYQTTGVPESFLLDRKGRLIKRVIGAHDWNSTANRDLIKRLLAEDS